MSVPPLLSLLTDLNVEQKTSNGLHMCFNDALERDLPCMCVSCADVQALAGLHMQTRVEIDSVHAHFMKGLIRQDQAGRSLR